MERHGVDPGGTAERTAVRVKKLGAVIIVSIIFAARSNKDFAVSKKNGFRGSSSDGHITCRGEDSGGGIVKLRARERTATVSARDQDFTAVEESGCMAGPGNGHTASGREDRSGRIVDLRAGKRSSLAIVATRNQDPPISEQCCRVFPARSDHVCGRCEDAGRWIVKFGCT